MVGLAKLKKWGVGREKRRVGGGGGSGFVGECTVGLFKILKSTVVPGSTRRGGEIFMKILRVTFSEPPTTPPTPEI